MEAFLTFSDRLFHKIGVTGKNAHETTLFAGWHTPSEDLDSGMHSGMLELKIQKFTVSGSYHDFPEWLQQS